MPKTRTVFVCQECGAQSPKWLGQCADCGRWNTFVGEAASQPQAAVGVPPAEARSITSVETLEGKRMTCGIEALDRVLGGGLVPGSVTLIGGDPGIGKSTVLTQVAGRVAALGGRSLYISGEESTGQVKLRAERIGAVNDEFRLANTTDLNEGLALIRGTRPDFIVIDSIQTMAAPELGGAAGSVSQVRHCAAVLQAEAKGGDAAVMLVGHVTKEGSIAGPRVLEHLVDAVLYFEGEGHGRLRALRAVKNRFGSTDEIAVFEMTEAGLEPVENPSAAFLAERQAGAPGSAVFPAVEGTRPLLVEIQALVTPNYTNSPRRTVTGLDFNRVLLVLSVIEKRCGIRMGGYDAFLNAVGGLQVREPAADLAIFLAVVSSVRDTPLPPDIVAFGEIGLTGEIRSVACAELRLREAARLGFTRAAVSKFSKSATKAPGIKAGAFRSVSDALGLVEV